MCLPIGLSLGLRNPSIVGSPTSRALAVERNKGSTWIDTAMGRIVLTPSVGDYGYIDRDAPDSKWVRIVPHVQGRSEKGRLNDKRYQTASGSTFSGTFMIVNKQ